MRNTSTVHWKKDFHVFCLDPIWTLKARLWRTGLALDAARRCEMDCLQNRQFEGESLTRPQATHSENPHHDMLPR